MTVDTKQFGQMLRSRGLKVTKQRLRVLQVLALCPDKHLTAEEIFDLVKADCPEIGLATVYRTIQLLHELNLIDRINLDDGFVRYEMGNTQGEKQKHHHHHLICTKCGKVISFQDDFLEEFEDRITRTTGFVVMNHEVKLYGYCVECGGNLIEEEKRE